MGRPGPFDHVNDVSVYQSRQRGGEESLIEKMHFTHVFFVLNQEWHDFRFTKLSKLQDQVSSPFFRWGTDPPFCHDVIHVINAPRPSPSVFAYCKWSKTGRWEDLRTRLIDTYLLTLYIVYRGRKNNTFCEHLIWPVCFPLWTFETWTGTTSRSSLESLQPGIHTPSIFAL